MFKLMVGVCKNRGKVGFKLARGVMVQWPAVGNVHLHGTLNFWKKRS